MILAQFSSDSFVSGLSEDIKSLLRMPADDTNITRVPNNKEGQATCTGWFV